MIAARADVGSVRVRDPARAASRRRSSRSREPVPRAGRRGARRDGGLHGQGRRLQGRGRPRAQRNGDDGREGGRLDRPARPAVLRHGPHLLAIQKYKADDPPPYDDTGWTLDELRHVRTLTIADSTVLAKPMQLLTTDATVTGTIAGTGQVLVVQHLGDWRSAVLPWKVAAGRVSVADTAFTAGRRRVPRRHVHRGDASQRDAAMRSRTLGLGATAVTQHPDGEAARHLASAHRAAALVARDPERRLGALRVRPAGHSVHVHLGSGAEAPRNARPFRRRRVPARERGGDALVNGRPMIGPAVPWKKSARTPNLGGYDETDDIRPGWGSTAPRRCARSSSAAGCCSRRATALPCRSRWASTRR